MLRMTAFALLFGAAACQNGVQKTVQVPAQLSAITATTEAELQAAISLLLGRANVTLGAGLQVGAKSISVLPQRPSPYEGNSPALPDHFDFILIGETCHLVHRQTGKRKTVQAVSCESRDAASAG